MSELTAFIALGFGHITNPEALDHVLFLLALAAIYRGRDWRDSLWVVTAFTVGHSVTLALAVTGALTLGTPLIEFLIPVTIVLTGSENILVRNRARAPFRGRYRPVLAGVFGLVHGAGFANYLRGLFPDSIGVPLLGFNIGIEAGQVAVLALCAIALSGVDRAISGILAPHAGIPAHRLRTLAVSVAVVVSAMRMAAERTPW